MHRSTRAVQSTSAGGTAGPAAAARAAVFSLRMEPLFPSLYPSRSIPPGVLVASLLPFEAYPFPSRGAVAGDHKPLVRERLRPPASTPGHVATALMGRNTAKRAD